MKRALTSDELIAITWIKSNYRRWRKKLKETREEFQARIPKGMNPDIWASWYDHPFGDQELNRMIQTARRVLQEGLV